MFKVVFIFLNFLYFTSSLNPNEVKALKALSKQGWVSDFLKNESTSCLDWHCFPGCEQDFYCDDQDSLWSLQCKNCNPPLVGTIPTEIGLLSVQYLNFGGNNIHGTIPKEIGSSILATNVTQIIFSQNALTDKIPEEIYNNKALTILGLSQNKLIGTISQNIGNLSGLLSIDLSKNYLSGPVPDVFAGFNQLAYVLLSFNSLTGPIPLSLAGLSAASLNILDLSTNQFTGPIPPTLFQQRKILVNQVLMIDHNNLTGTIPKSIASLTTENFYLFRAGGNLLEGAVPNINAQFCGLRDFQTASHDNQQLDCPWPKQCNQEDIPPYNIVYGKCSQKTTTAKIANSLPLYLNKFQH